MTSTTAELSVIILNHRHDKRLQEAIKSAQFADEILIFDYLSGADYKQLKNKLDFKVFQMKTELEDFAVARNDALAEAKNKWVFFLDSDEQIREEDQRKIVQIIKHGLADGVFVKRRDSFLGKALNFGEPRQNRLLRMGKKSLMKWDRPVHEVAWVEGDIIESDICLIHQAHLNMTEFIDDINHYAQAEAEYRHQKGLRFELWQLLLLPLGKFLYNFVLKLGFLDGWRGLIYAFVMSLHSLTVRAGLYELTTPHETK